MLNPVIPELLEVVAGSVLPMELSVHCTHLTATNDTVHLTFQGQKRVDVYFLVNIHGKITLLRELFAKVPDRLEFDTIDEAVGSLLLWLIENYTKG